MAGSTKTAFMSLTDDAILHILSYLEYNDLISCCHTCHRLQGLSHQDSLWRALCKFHWKQTKCPEGLGWYEHFVEWFKDYGRYIHIFRQIKSAWDQIETYMSSILPAVKESLQDGLSDEEIDTIEREMGAVFPDDLRCAYRIHNGQSIATDGVGLMGYDAVSVRHTHSNPSQYLLPLHHNMYSCRTQHMQGCYCLTGLILFNNVNHGISINYYCVLSEEAGFTRGRLLVCDDEKENTFIVSNNFFEWFTKLAQGFEDNIYHMIDNMLYCDFISDPTCVAVTGYISVAVATAFLPRFSSIGRPHFVHTYHITMSMSDDAPESEKCQLESRHWVVTNERGDEERVNGPGVIGEFPTIRPGEKFTWVSYTSFETTYGNMSGHFTMKNLQTGSRFNVACPRFHMKCLPYETSAERHEKILREKKDQ